MDSSQFGDWYQTMMNGQTTRYKVGVMQIYFHFLRKPNAIWILEAANTEMPEKFLLGASFSTSGVITVELF